MEFDAKYKDRGLAVIGVSMDEDGWKTVKPFLALEKDPETGGHTAMKYPVVIGSDSLAKQYLRIPDEADQRSGMMSITIPG
jgi:cytochrome c biogenesis protein CcmG/thiol:disulfide interchange protein DsbE